MTQGDCTLSLYTIDEGRHCGVHKEQYGKWNLRYKYADRKGHVNKAIGYGMPVDVVNWKAAFVKQIKLMLLSEME